MVDPPLSKDDLLAALTAIGVTAPVHAEREVTSTNSIALDLAAAGSPEWTLVSAAHQTAGRGRAGRSWVDVPDRALMVSVVLRPDVEPASAGLLSLLAGASMALAIREEPGLEATCKWPNDILVGGGKVGGILGEARVADGLLDTLVVGVGINLEAPAGVAQAAAIGPVDARSLLTRFLRGLHAGYRGPPSGLAERVRAMWLPVADTIGRRVEATASSGEQVRGVATGIDPSGGLIVATGAGARRVVFGDLVHLAGE